MNKRFRSVVYLTIMHSRDRSASLTMNEILSNNLSEKCLRRKRIVFMRYIVKYCSVKVQILQHNVDMNIDHFINVLF